MLEKGTTRSGSPTVLTDHSLMKVKVIVSAASTLLKLTASSLDMIFNQID